MRYILATIISLFVFGIYAQQPIPTQDIAVKDTVPYTEKITVGEDTELTLTISFSEKYNILTASLSSESRFLSFAEPVRYKETKRQWLWKNYLSPKKMPYPINFEYGSKYRYSKGFLKKLRRPKDGNIYQPLFTVYGMAPMGFEQQYMVNDSVFQIFQVDSTRNDVFIDLGDIITMAVTSKSRPGKMRYKLSTLNHLDKKYKITLQRNLCSGMADTIAAVERSVRLLDDNLKLLQELHANFENAPSKGGVTMFNTIKDVLMKKCVEYPKWDPCTQLQQGYQQYNDIVAQISAIECVLNIPEEDLDDIDPRNPRLDVPTLLNIIRTLDRIKLNIVSATDEDEIQDLKLMAEGLIGDGQDLIDSSSIISDREKKTRDNFYSAVESFKRYCK